MTQKKTSRSPNELELRQKLAALATAAEKLAQKSHFMDLVLHVALEHEAKLQAWIKRKIFFGVDVGPDIERAAFTVVEAFASALDKQFAGEGKGLLLTEDVEVFDYLTDLVRKQNLARDIRNRCATNLPALQNIVGLKRHFAATVNKDAFVAELIARTVCMSTSHHRLKTRLPHAEFAQQKLVDGGLAKRFGCEVLKTLLWDSADHYGNDHTLDAKLVKELRALGLTKTMLEGPVTESIQYAAKFGRYGARHLAVDVLTPLAPLQFAVHVDPDASDDGEEAVANDSLYGVEAFDLDKIDQRAAYMQLKPADKFLLLLSVRPFRTFEEFLAMARGVGALEGLSTQTEACLAKLQDVLAKETAKGQLDYVEIAEITGLKPSTVLNKLSALNKKFGLSDPKAGEDDDRLTA